MYGAALVLLGLGIWRLAADGEAVPELARLEALANRGEAEEAERGLLKVVARSPRYGDAWRLLARLRARRGDLRGCAEALAAMPEWWPDKREAWFLEGQAWLGLNQARRAEAAWRACVEDDPHRPLVPEYLNGAAKGLIALYIVQERVSEAHAVMEQVQIQSAPEERAAILGTRMRAETDRIEPREAVEILSRYVAADPEDGASRRALARALNTLRRYDEADAVLEEWLRRHPEDREGWVTRVRMLDERSDFEGLERAIAALPAGLDVDPFVVQARGVIAESRGDLEAAEAAFRRALELAPFDPQAHFRQARVLRRLGRGDEAAAEQAAYQAIRSAREAVPGAINELATLGTRGGPEAKALYGRLARICETVGWLDLARAWRGMEASAG
jgi:tetratricopeptide (TPR) repeat protein